MPPLPPSFNRVFGGKCGGARALCPSKPPTGVSCIVIRLSCCIRLSGLFRFVLGTLANRRGARPQRLPFSGSCAPLPGRAITHAPVGALATLGREVGTFFVGYRSVLRARRQGVSRWCGCPAFAPLPAFSNVRRIPTLFVGYRHLNRQQKINDLRRFASGAVCPPRTPPECFSWFYFAFALFAGTRKFDQIAPSGRVCWLRPPMLEKHQPYKKRGLKQPSFL